MRANNKQNAQNKSHVVFTHASGSVKHKTILIIQQRSCGNTPGLF